MKIVHLLIYLILFSLTSYSWALSSPEYLNVPRWKCCVDTVLHATSKSICLPKERPSTCSLESWKKLNKGPMITRCAN